MEETTTENTTAPEATTQVETPAAETQTASAEAPASTEAAEAAPEWKPNFEFVVKDTKHKFDDLVQPLVKTKEVEEKLRDLYSKAYGLDEVKADRQTVREKLQQAEEKYSRVETSLKTLGDYVGKGDFRSFFDALQIPREKIIRYAIEELKYAELPPEQRQVIEQEREMKQRIAAMEYENQSLQQQQANFVAQQVHNELRNELSKPEVSQIAQAYDARVGKPGAFEQEVIKRGAYYEAVHKTTVPVGQAVQEVLMLAGVQAAQQTSASQVVSGQGATKKPVIPNFNGSSGASPTKKVPNSVDDLRKIRENLLAQQG